MATLIASAKLTNVFRVRLVDKNVSAALTTTSTFTASALRTLRTYIDLESTSSLANTMRYATKGGKGEFAVSSSVVCEFPTYLEIDIEALMLQGLPEGTDCVLNFEEGWQLEDRGNLLPSGAYEYGSNTQDSPSPEFPSFVTFRTPKFFRSAFSSVFSLPNIVLRIKQVQSSVSSASTVFAFGFLNPGKLAALVAGVSQMVPIARKTAVSGATLFSSSGPFGPIALGLRIKQLLASVSSITNLTTDFTIVQTSGANLLNNINFVSIVEKFKGLIDSYAIVSTASITAQKTARGLAQLLPTATITTILGIIKRFVFARSSAFTLSVFPTHNQFPVRWRETAVFGTFGTGLQTNNDSSAMAVVSYATTSYRTYSRTGGTITLTQNGNLAITNSNKNQIGINKTIGFLAATGGSFANWKIHNFATNTAVTISGEAYILAAFGAHVYTWNGSNNNYRQYNINGTIGTTYTLLQNRSTTPYTMAVGSNSSSGFILLVAALSDNTMFLWNNQGAQTVQTFALSGLSPTTVISLADNGETFAVSSPTTNTVYVFGRSGTANTTTTLLQTITSSVSGYGTALSLGANGQHLLIGKEYWIRSGSTFTRNRDVDFVNGNYTSEIMLAFDSNDNSVEAVNVIDSQLAVYTFS